ncbi:MAG: hypothetical protein H7Z43_01090 [Clostridia bacterium]|nr:hypothetical protein [Deltaproteobacteria bacterium]
MSREKVGEAARRLLERLDVVEANEERRMEQAFYKVIRETADQYRVTQRALWEEALTVERDPVERHRDVIGAGWSPALK